MKIDIKLDKPDLKYQPGEVLNGSVTINNAEEKKVRYVCIVVSGVAQVLWRVTTTTRDSKGNVKRKTTRYHSREQYLNSETVIFGEIDGPTVKYPPGIHTYNFTCTLPDRLPGTLKSHEATIEYKVECLMDVPWGFDVTHELPFVIYNVVDLNANSAIKLPVQADETKSFCFFTCYKEKAYLSATIPQGGYVAGQEIPILCRIDNLSGVSLISITFELQRIVRATATSPRTTHRDSEYSLEKKEHIFEADEKTSNACFDFRGRLTVPETPVSCHIAAYVDNSYFVTVLFRVKGCHRNVVLRLPVEIGTYPLGAAGHEDADKVPLAPMPEPSAPTLNEPGTSAPDVNVLTPSAPVLEKIDSEEEQPPAYEDAARKEK